MPTAPPNPLQSRSLFPGTYTFIACAKKKTGPPRRNGIDVKPPRTRQEEKALIADLIPSRRRINNHRGACSSDYRSPQASRHNATKCPVPPPTAHLHPKKSVSGRGAAATSATPPGAAAPGASPPGRCSSPSLCRRRSRTTLRMGATPVPGPTRMSGWWGDCGSLNVPGRMERGTWERERAATKDGGRKKKRVRSWK